MSIVVLTYATHDQGYFKTLKESCTRFGYDLRVLGFGEKWKGYGKKFIAVIEALQSLPPDQLVMFVDAFDVFMCGPASDAIEGYKQAGSPPMLVGASRCFTGAEDIHRQVFNDNLNSISCPDSPYNILCSGTYMCTAENGYELLSSLLPIQESADDQILLASLRNKHGDDVIKLDCGFFVFATLIPPFMNLGVPEKDKISVVIKDGVERVYSGVTKTFPCVVHGPANAILTPIVEAMQFDEDTNDVPTSFLVEKFCYHTCNFLSTFCVFIVLGLVIILLICVIIYLLLSKQSDNKNLQLLEKKEIKNERTI